MYIRHGTRLRHDGCGRSPFPQVEHPHAETDSGRALQGTERFLVYGGTAALCLYPFQGGRCGASE